MVGSATWDEVLLHASSAATFYCRVRWTLPPEDEEEIAQEVAMRVWATWHPDGGASVKTYSYRIARNLVASRLRPLRRVSTLNDVTDEVDRAELREGGGNDPAIAVLRQADLEALTEALAAAERATSSEHRAMTVLKYVNGYTYKEIAEAHGVSWRAVERRILTFLAKCREALDDSEPATRHADPRVVAKGWTDELS